MKLAPLALAALASLTTAVTFTPTAQAAGTTPYWLSKADTCHVNQLTAGQNMSSAKCGPVTRVNFTYTCRKFSRSAGRVTDAKCQSKDLSTGEYRALVKRWYDQQAHGLRLENKAQREADLAAGRVIVPGVPVTPSMLVQQRANDAHQIWWYNATPAERAELQRYNAELWRQGECRDIYGSGSNMITVDWCTGETW